MLTTLARPGLSFYLTLCELKIRASSNTTIVLGVGGVFHLLPNSVRKLRSPVRTRRRPTRSLNQVNIGGNPQECSFDDSNLTTASHVEIAPLRWRWRPSRVARVVWRTPCSRARTRRSRRSFRSGFPRQRCRGTAAASSSTTVTGLTYAAILTRTSRSRLRTGSSDRRRAPTSSGRCSNQLVRSTAMLALSAHSAGRRWRRGAAPPHRERPVSSRAGEARRAQYREERAPMRI